MFTCFYRFFLCHGGLEDSVGLGWAVPGGCRRVQVHIGDGALRYDVTARAFGDGAHPASPLSDVTARVLTSQGHVLSIDFKPEFNNWDAVKPIELFTAGTIKTETRRGMARHLQRRR